MNGPIDHLFKSCFPDSKIAADLVMKKDKCTATVKNVIGESQKEYLENILRHQKFSVLADESTDIAKQYALLSGILIKITRKL